ncbi:MAG: cation diffusion facilitator family transporter [Mariprofundaceae bacterium]|nr:cation diffusion facilitator family transporter [Mariprofundaceae bacterium]
MAEQPDKTRALPQQESARLMRLATYASTATAAILITAKLMAWMITDAVSMLATLIDSTLDVLASMINLLAVRHALVPADRQHRFGHGKAEALAGLGQATFITGSAAFLLLEAVRRFFHPQAVEIIGIGVGVMIFSIIATLVLLAIQHHVIEKTGSTAIRADSLHYKTDVLVNASVIGALLLAFYGWPGFDPVFAIAIAIYILYNAWEIARESVQHLMDQELPDEERENITSIVLGHRHVKGMHDLRTRRSGTTTFIQLHLELDDELTLLRAHAIADAVEAEIRKAYPNAEVLIHEDPASLTEPQPVFNE